MSEEMIPEAFDHKGFAQRVRAHLKNDLASNGRITPAAIGMIGAEAEFFAKRAAYNPNERLREAASALLAKLDQTLPPTKARPTIAELERTLAAGNDGAIEIKPDGSIYVAPREEIEALRSALFPLPQGEDT